MMFPLKFIGHQYYFIGENLVGYLSEQIRVNRIL